MILKAFLIVPTSPKIPPMEGHDMTVRKWILKIWELIQFYTAKGPKVYI